MTLTKCTNKFGQYRYIHFPGGSDGKASVYNAGDLSSIPGSGSSLEKEKATHSSTLAQKIPWTEEPGGHGVAKSRTRLSDFTFMHWRRKWQPTPVFLPGESQGQGSLVGCRLWGRTESDMTEETQQQQQRYTYFILLIKSAKIFNGLRNIGRYCQ